MLILQPRFWHIGGVMQQPRSVLSCVAPKRLPLKLWLNLCFYPPQGIIPQGGGKGHPGSMRPLCLYRVLGLLKHLERTYLQDAVRFFDVGAGAGQ
jgi:hypothetical protein